MSDPTCPGPCFGWIPLFRDVPEADLKAALEGCQILELPANAALLTPGQENDSIFIILAGEVRVYIHADGGQGITIPIGQCIGEFSAIDGRPASALVRAETEARVLRLERDRFWSHLIGLPGVARNMMISLTERARLTNQLALEAQRSSLELEHLHKELQLARELQAGMLPVQQPLFPERHEIEISGLIEPASTVGGDFFDAFFVSEQLLFLCIGDVSGHGIGAALLMARTVGLLRVLAMAGNGPEEVLNRLNESLAEGNTTCVFVTLFCGFLDLESGELVYSNGGHCPPLLITAGGAQPIPLPAGVLVGAFASMRYSAMSLQLHRNDLLFLYTDGITEAENRAGDFFGVDGCLRVLGQGQETALPALLEGLRREVERFRGRDVLEDDGTMLALRIQRESPAGRGGEGQVLADSTCRSTPAG
jgi:phosphoserine phosphatase RsbU/P